MFYDMFSESETECGAETKRMWSPRRSAHGGKEGLVRRNRRRRRFGGQRLSTQYVLGKSEKRCFAARLMDASRYGVNRYERGHVEYPAWMGSSGRQALLAGTLLFGLVLGTGPWEGDFLRLLLRAGHSLTWETGRADRKRSFPPFMTMRHRTYEVRLRLPAGTAMLYWPFGAEEHPILTVDDRQVGIMCTVPHTTIWGK